jgi:hypothetical protein
MARLRFPRIFVFFSLSVQQGEEAAEKEYDPDPVGYINET